MNMGLLPRSTRENFSAPVAEGTYFKGYVSLLFLNSKDKPLVWLLALTFNWCAISPAQDKPLVFHNGLQGNSGFLQREKNGNFL